MELHWLNDCETSQGRRHSVPFPLRLKFEPVFTPNVQQVQQMLLQLHMYSVYVLDLSVYALIRVTSGHKHYE